MNNEKLIVIGCDDTVHLSAILNSIKELSFPYNIITATRTTDIIRIVGAMNPQLVILCFRNNQHILNDFDMFSKNNQLPIICLSDKAETETLSWNANTIVFSYINEHLNNKYYLSSRINSIFLMNKVMQVSEAMLPAENLQEKNTSELSRYVMELDQKAEVLAKVKNKIAELYPRVSDTTRLELTAIVNTIKIAGNNKHLWDDFKLYFEQTNPSFLYILAQKHPLLTPIDLKYCCYLKMNMTNDDIRNLLGINQESVRTHKYRLKKKMSLPKDQDLRNYLISVS